METHGVLRKKWSPRCRRFSRFTSQDGSVKNILSPTWGCGPPLSKWCLPPVRYPWISHIVHGIIWVISMVILWKTTYILSGMHIQVCRPSMIHGIGRYIPSWMMMNRSLVNDFEPGGPQYPTLVEPGTFGINMGQIILQICSNCDSQVENNIPSSNQTWLAGKS